MSTQTLGLLTVSATALATFVAGTIAALTGVSKQDSGVASGLQNTSFSIGTGIGVAVLSTVAIARTNDVLAGSGEQVQSPFALTEGYQFAFSAAVVVALLGLVAALTLLSRSRVD